MTFRLYKNTFKITSPLSGLSLKFQLMILYGALIVSVTAFSSWLVSSQTQAANTQQIQNIGTLLSEQTAKAAANMLMTGDRLSLSILLNNLVQSPYINQASIYSIDNQRIGHAKNTAVPLSHATQITPAPIHSQDVIAGYVHLSLNDALLKQSARGVIHTIFAINALLLVIGLALVYLFGDKITRQLQLIERQLRSVLTQQPGYIKPKGEVARIAALLEHQLTEKNKESAAETSELTESEISAIVAIRPKNMSRLQQILAPQDLILIVEQNALMVEEAARRYNGTVSYSPEGNCYIRFSTSTFSTMDGHDFALNALHCSLLIQANSHDTVNHSVATLQIGLGLCISDTSPEYPESKHPALEDSAASQALMLASLPGTDGLHLLREQLSWFPPESIEIDVCGHGDDIVLAVSSLSLDSTIKHQTE